MELQEVLDQFRVEGIVDQIKPFGNGHIHETYHVVNRDKTAPDFLLQKINDQVFQDVAGMMNNIQLVTHYLKKQAPDQTNLELILTRERQSYQEFEGTFWRVFVFLDGLISYDTLSDENLVYEGGKTLGDFLNQLSGLNPKRLVETIPNFHDLSFRFRQFEMALKNASESLKSRVIAEIEQVKNYERLALFDFVEYMPVRTTHNDTKLNNVLFDQHGKAQCVIDLDTVMPGVVHFDFGDAIRTACAAATEDESDLQLVGLDLERVQAFSVGYLQSARDLLTREELDTLHFSIPMMSFIMGVRFLTDFLQRDRYYKTHYPDQNMHRARAQLQQTATAMDQIDDLKRIVKNA